MSILKLLGQHTFDVQTTRILASVFDTAWLALQKSHSDLADDKVVGTRDLLARRIVEIAERGERDPRSLIDGALAQFSSTI